MTFNTLYVQGTKSLQFTVVIKHKNSLWCKRDIMGQFPGVKALEFGMSSLVQQ